MRVLKRQSKIFKRSPVKGICSSKILCNIAHQQQFLQEGIKGVVPAIKESLTLLVIPSIPDFKELACSDDSFRFEKALINLAG